MFVEGKQHIPSYCIWRQNCMYDFILFCSTKAQVVNNIFTLILIAYAGNETDYYPSYCHL